MEFGVLGPLEVTDGRRRVWIPSAKQRMLLAALLLRAGELVTLDELAEAIWGDALPDDPRKVVQTYISRLRQRLGGAGLIHSQPEGYVLAVARDEVDLGRFEILVEQAREAADSGDRHREAALLRKALELWRGEPLADISSAALHREVVARLAEQRLEALHRRIEAELALGRHVELVAELRALTEQHPLREQFWAQLMTALYRCGRQADALEAYQRVRRLLAEELGMDPGPGLRALHQAILTGDPALMVPATSAGRGAWVGQFQLPVDVGDFVGRVGLIDQVTSLLDDDRRVPIVALSGPAGVGKTALAVHVAHRLAGRFPDGQLYVDLHGAAAGPRPLQPLEVLGRFLRALGMQPAAVPASLEEASGAFRSWVAGRRLLVVLDNAAAAAQVVPLLPAGAGCGVVVTSRRVLAGLVGAAHLRLDGLADAEVLELLGRLAGRERLAAEPEAAAEVARCCGSLPLALRIAGARLAARPAWPVRALAERLADQERRLDELEIGEVRVRASFQVSHQQLHCSDDLVDREAAGAFGLLGLLDGPEVGVPVAARLLDASEPATERVLERLVDAQLLETPALGRYRLHDLLRLYARELAHQHHPEPARAAALTRALGFYVASAWRTLALLRPGDYRLERMDEQWRKGGLEFADEQAALSWLEIERANLLAAIRQAAATPGVQPEIAVQLTHALVGFFWVRGHWDDLVEVNRIALTVARRTGDLAAQAQAHNDLGGAYCWLGYAEALACHQQSLAIRRELGDLRGVAASLNNLGNLHQWYGHYDEALTCLREGLAIFRELGDRAGEGLSVGNLGEAYQQQGRDREALACLRQSLDIRRDLGDLPGQAHCLRTLGIVLQRQDREEAAVACLRESLTIYRELGARESQADSCHNLGVVYRQQGQYDQALASLREGLAIRRELGEPRAEAESLRELGVTLRESGRGEEARMQWLEALAIFERLRTTDADQVRALLAELPAHLSR